MATAPASTFPHGTEAKLAASYFLLASAAIFLTRLNGGIALLWVANAPLILFLRRQPRAARWWSALAWTAPASVAASLLFGPVAWAAPFFGMAGMIEAVIAALLLQRMSGDQDPFESTRSAVIFIAVVGFVGPASGAVIGATTAVVALHKPWLATFADWVLGRGLGTLIASPIVLLLMAADRGAWAKRLLSELWGEGGVLLTAVALVTAAVFWQERLPLLFLPALPVLLATFKLGRPGAALSILLVAVIGGGATATGHGPVMIISQSRVAQLQFFQIYLAATFLMSLPIAAALGQREQLMLALRESNRLFEMAGSLAAIGHWRIDLAARHAVWSDEVFRMHGLEIGTPPALAEAINFYHPDDQERVAAIVHEAIATRTPFAYTARLIRADGSVRHIVAQGQVDLDDAGTASAMFGIFQDVTQREIAAETLRDAEARVRLITEQANDMIAVIARDGTCLFMSPASQTILGLSPEALTGTRLSERAHEDDRPAIERHRKAMQSRDASASSLRFRMRRADGDFAWLEASSRLVELGQTPCIVSVWRDVSRQVAIEAELKAAKVDAEAATLAKAGFLANMSHEIRTPMNGVIGFAELLMASDLSPDQRRDVGLIVDSGKAMMKLLNDILDLSKIEAGQLDIVAEPFDLPHAVRACGKLLEPGAARKNLRFEVRIADDVPQFVRADGLRLRQIVLNLVGNAIKFTEQGSVLLAVRRVEEEGQPWLAITVRDTGIGIATERQESIFEEFVQADHSITRRHGGTGLGLAISNRLAAQMGGRIYMASTVGRGTTMTVRLPATPVEAPAASAPTPAAAIPPKRVPSRILLAEDHEVNQLLVQSMLARGGHQVVLVENGQAALDAFRESVELGTPFDLVLMDMQMPVMDGLAAARAIRASEGRVEQRVPIVALTANAFASDLESCRQAGMDDHVAKPISLETLLAAVDRWSRAAVTASQPLPVRAGGFQPSAAAQAKYAEHRARTLEQVDALIRHGTFTDEELQAAAGLLHKLAGTAGMFGESALGEHAGALEDGLLAWPATERDKRIAATVALLREAA